MKEFSERLYFALEKQLYKIAIQPISECDKLKQTLFSCKKALAILKRFLKNNFFEDPESEIVFFKMVKPQFYSKYIYYVFVYKYFIRKPLGCENILESYILAELKELENFILKHQAFSIYYRSNATHLDYRVSLKTPYSPLRIFRDYFFSPLFFNLFFNKT